MARMMKAPAAPSGLVRTNLTISSESVSCGARVAVAVGCATSMCVAMRLPVPDARVEPRIGEVHEEVDDHEAERDQKHERLHDRVVAMGDGVDDEPADAVQREHRLGDNEAADEES